MTHPTDAASKALFQCLVEGPMLMGDLPEAAAFPCHSLVPPQEASPLNLQQKLGYLYEDALAVMLESTPRYEAVARGIQVRQVAGHTLGELDFLVRDLVLGRLIHLELAVKFYLAVESDSGFLLPGPDARDNYFRKLEKMRSHQLRLVEKYRDLLPQEYREEEIVVQQLVQGCIFNHVKASRPVEAEFLNPQGRRGKWLHAEECAEYFGKNARLEIIPKPLWPVPLEILEGMVLEKWEVDEDMDRCVMVRADAGDIPYFIAPRGYPATGSARRRI
ncbi:MAG: DUF1853 family protein [Luteolibacter sp.]